MAAAATRHRCSDPQVITTHAAPSAIEETACPLGNESAPDSARTTRWMRLLEAHRIANTSTERTAARRHGVLQASARRAAARTNAATEDQLPNAYRETEGRGRSNTSLSPRPRISAP